MNRLFSTAISIVLLSSLAPRLHSATPAAAPLEETPVFITIGQSNADGSAYFDPGEDARLKAWYDSDANPRKMKIWYRSSQIVNQPDGARLVFDGTVTDVEPGWLDLWYRNENTDGRTAMNMIHSFGTWSTGPGTNVAQGRRGMEGEFGMRFQQAFPDKDLHIIKLGCSGSAIDTWTSAGTNHNWEYFYDNIFTPAMESLLEQGKKPRLAGVWWMQGCADAARDSAYYRAALEDVIAKCRTTLGFPDAQIYIGRIVRPGESDTNPTASRQWGPGVRAAQNALALPESPERIARVDLIDNRDCPFQDDNLHYNHVGVNRIGRKLAERVVEAGPARWAEFTTPGTWSGLDTDAPLFTPAFGHPTITYTLTPTHVDALLDYGTWHETVSARRQ